MDFELDLVKGKHFIVGTVEVYHRVMQIVDIQ